MNGSRKRFMACDTQTYYFIIFVCFSLLLFFSLLGRVGPGKVCPGREGGLKRGQVQGGGEMGQQRSGPKLVSLGLGQKRLCQKRVLSAHRQALPHTHPTRTHTHAHTLHLHTKDGDWHDTKTQKKILRRAIRAEK